jgi:hypothetical protein
MEVHLGLRGDLDAGVSVDFAPRAKSRAGPRVSTPEMLMGAKERVGGA